MQYGKRKRYIGAAIMTGLIFISALSACSGSVAAGETAAQAPTSGPEPAAAGTPVHSAGQIYLYGEEHGVEEILAKEFQIWDEYYRREGMRHLFIEYPYYTAEYLNLWMQSDSDAILDSLYEDWEGSDAQNPYIKVFFQRIKRECPETVFHGTDVGHQYSTTGERFIKRLRDNNLTDTQEYRFAQKVMEQGRHYYESFDDMYRENKMAENFISEFDGLDGENIMGIYGAVHTGFGVTDTVGTASCMTSQLKDVYKDAVHPEDVRLLAKETEPYRTDVMAIGGKDYEASYFGRQDLTGFRDYSYREFWRLEGAYDDFRDNPKTGDQLPYDNYPMRIETGQVFVIDLVKTDGSVGRFCYRSDGGNSEGNPITEEFTN